MKEKLQSSPEVDLNPHSDLPAAGVISAEISEPSSSGERQGVSPPCPFGVYFGEPVPAVSENRTPQT